MGAADGSVVHQYLSFIVAGDEYGVGILQVMEIVEHTTITRMPSMPACIRGVTNLRGRVVPVVDLALRMGLPETKITRRSCIVMVEAELDADRTVVGLLVDAVSQVVELPPGEIEPAPTFGTRIRVDYIRGMGRVGRGFVPLLDLARLLDAEELLAGMRAPEAAPAAEPEAPAAPEPPDAAREAQPAGAAAAP